VDILNIILKRYGKPPVSYEEYRDEFDFPVKDYYTQLGFDFSVESFDEIAGQYLSVYNKKRFKCKLHNGAADVLKSCAARGITQSILSAYPQDMLEEIVDFFGIRPFFIKLLGLKDNYAGGKLENGKKLIKELGIENRHILLIGDTIHDFDVAKAIGTDCVLISNGHHSREKLELCGARIIDSIKDVGILPEFISD
jgi:phosphoglycolate phosphatase